MKENNEESITSTKFYNGINIDYLGKSTDSISTINNNKTSSNNSENQMTYKKTIINYLCVKCKQFPIIEFLDKKNIIYTCNCSEKKNKKISITDIFKQEKKFLNIKKANIFSELIDYLDNNGNNINLYEENKGFRSIKNKSNKIKKFKYYCPKCKEHLYKECCSNHPCGNNYLIIFDYINQNSKKQIEFIKKKINQHIFSVFEYS